MNQTLQQAIVGEPVTVTLGGVEYPIAFPIQAVILYKQETAVMDRHRGFSRLNLDPAKIRELREARRKLLLEAQDLAPAKGAEWDPEKYAQYDALMDDATAIKIQLDEYAGTGDSLYDMHNWRKISLDGDPERLLLALWVGMHRFEGGLTDEAVYAAPLSREQLGSLVHMGNGAEVALAISKALTAHLLTPKETATEDDDDENDSPNAAKPETTAPAAIPISASSAK